MSDAGQRQGETRQLARYEVRPEAVGRCLSAIREFVAYVKKNEPGTLRYEACQEPEHHAAPRLRRTIPRSSEWQGCST